MKEAGRKLLALLVVLAGVCLMSYPWISNWSYSHAVDSAVEVYQEEAAEADSGEMDELLENARQYNVQIAESRAALTDPFVFTEADGTDVAYESVLSIDDTGLMCFVDIPKIDVYLPVFHGTSEDVLQKGAGHLEGSSVPVGGEGTHAVLSAHTGISSSKMFSDLTEMEEGDLFFIHVLEETLAYRVCSIQVILPEETGSLGIEAGRDLVTLLTCTPYGVNTHRLVVTGERTEYTEEMIPEAGPGDIVPDSNWMREYKRALLAGLAAVAAAAFIVICARRIKGTADKRGREDAD